MLLPRTLTRYLVREIGAHLLAVFSVVLAVFLTRRLSLYLGDALEGQIPAEIVLEALGLRTAMALPSLLPAISYLAILLALGRMHEDLELTALSACGVSQSLVARIVLVASAVASLGIGILALDLRPRAAERLREVEREATIEARIGSLRPGRFYEVGGGAERVIFAESRSADGDTIEDVFVHSRTEKEIVIQRAKRAFDTLGERAGERTLRLVDGIEYRLRGDERGLDVTRFGTLALRTDLPIDDEAPHGEKLLSSRALFASSRPDDAAELQWRLSMPVSAFVLSLLALPLARIGSQRGRYAKLLAGMIIYLLYRQTLATAKDWVAAGALPAMPGLWLVHAVVLAAAIALLVLQQRGVVAQDAARSS